MSLTKEDLQAIRGIVEESVSGLKEDVSDLKEDVSVLKEDVSVLKEDVSGLKEDVSDLKTRMGNVESDMREVKVDLLENTLIPKVNEIAAYQKSVYERYSKDADRFEQKITIVDMLDGTVADHSRRIQKLECKQA